MIKFIYFLSLWHATVLNFRKDINDMKGTIKDDTMVLLFLLRKQESIPVGCIPTAAVAATRCQYWRGSALEGFCS